MNRQELLLCPNWNYHDVCEYARCEKSKAYQLIKVAKEQYKGTVRFNSRCVKRDSVLLAMGTSIEQETYIERRLNEKTLQG